MNQETNSSDARLQRIKTVSKIVRCIVLGLLAVTIAYWLFVYLFFSGDSLRNEPLGYAVIHGLLMLSLEIILCVWYWKLAQLFQFYERGLIFAAPTIRCIKTLGILCFVNGLFISVIHILNRLSPQPTLHVANGAVVRSVQSSLSMGFFSFSVYGINIGLLLTGIIIILIAWIMDEGRKIREEQELTV